MKVSVLINTFNEERNIRNCLECVKWADEIIVVDMYSDDRTVEIARKYTDKIFMHERIGFADPARQFTLEKASNDWILAVDADELVPRRLRDRLVELAASGKYDAVLSPHRNYFFGRAMVGACWGPLQDMHIRFFRKRFMRFSDKIHDFSHLDPSARIFRLTDEDCAFVHFNYLDVEHFIERLNRYTTIEATGAWRKGRRPSVALMLYGVVKEIGKRFIVRKGYRDGFQGLALALLMASYRVASELKLYLADRYGTENPRRDILREYEALAARMIGEHESALLPQAASPESAQKG